MMYLVALHPVWRSGCPAYQIEPAPTAAYRLSDAENGSHRQPAETGRVEPRVSTPSGSEMVLPSIW